MALEEKLQTLWGTDLLLNYLLHNLIPTGIQATNKSQIMPKEICFNTKQYIVGPVMNNRHIDRR